MSFKGLHDRKGELIAYLDGVILYTLEGEITGRIEGDYIVDTAGSKVWRIQGDGVYSLETMESIGYFSSETPEDY